jgi:hypothetical protein
MKILRKMIDDKGLGEASAASTTTTTTESKDGDEEKSKKIGKTAGLNFTNQLVQSALQQGQIKYQF